MKSTIEFIHSDQLVNYPLDPDKGPLSKSANALGVVDLHSLCHFIANLPYKRTSNPTDFTQVLSEQRGTCSGKSAVIAAIGEEQNWPIELILTIYPIIPSKSPKLTDLAQICPFPEIPEAHCLLRIAGHFIDLLKQDREEKHLLIYDLTVIKPDQIGTFRRHWQLDFFRQYTGSETKALELQKWRDLAIETLTK